VRSLPDLIASVPSGGAYVRLVRGGVCYLGGPYASRELACESAGRLVCHVPGVTSIAIDARPHVTAPSCHHCWYARATFLADGYTAVVGPYPSRRRARSDLMDIAGRGQIGAWHEWAIDYHQVLKVQPPRRSALMPWHRSSSPPHLRPLAGAPLGAPNRWTRNGDRIARWIAAGGHPETSRDDLLRDIVMLWDDWPPEAVVWDVLATVLATIAAAPRANAPDSDGVAGALLELAAAIEDRAARDPGAEADIRRLVRALRPPGEGGPAPG
jgi:hypothetical protein